ncbi:pectin lyase fold/virulence factor [Rhodocollybia butyracea]|uniref:Pectin lyase fold/virulence factor n=1 Tax=Rhodocollybia butyracea TaxID=206335 RepID=A0A9P5P7Q7_9AGAR|nr:pectin lyase fold/virulence factor [Rhodocollybia butyracea]
MFLFVFTTLACMLSSALASSTPVSTAKRAICTVNSVASSINLLGCTSVIITAFNVPAGNTINITAAPDASIVLAGSVTFAQTTTPGPLFTFNTSNALFNGNGFTFEGNGPRTSGGIFKPHPLVEFQGSGTFTNFNIKDSPAQAISIGMSAINKTLACGSDASNLSYKCYIVVHCHPCRQTRTVIYSDQTGCQSERIPMALVSQPVGISGVTVLNQGDCVAITSGNNILFLRNQCIGGHGMSIGPIATGNNVSGVTFNGNFVSTSMYGARINVNSNATNASVCNITYTGNSISANQKYGLLITQSYPVDFGTPGTNSIISNITFNGTPTQQVISTGQNPVVGVNCGNCAGNWSWTSLNATGGIDLVLSGGVRLIFNGLS